MKSIWKHFSLGAAALLLAGCAALDSAPKATYVLVHGAFQDQRAWSAVKPQLEAAGHKVVAVQLAGRAGDSMALDSISLDTYREQVAQVVQAEAAPVVLVGHSFGGITISNVAEKMPEKIKTLVYVAAYLPQAGAADQSLAKLSEADQWNGFNKQRQNFILSKDFKTASVLSEDIVMLFCADCSPADQQRTQRDLHQTEPLKPAATPVQLSAERYGRVDKVYIQTLRDRAVSPQMQEQMMAKTAVRKVFKLDTGHSPFLSQPQQLAQALLNLR